MNDTPIRRACGCIDVHTHVVPHSFPAYLGSLRDVPWPSMVDAQPCHRHVMISGRVFRTVSNRAWDAGVRLADMDGLGVDRHVLSPMPELLSYWLDPHDGAALSRYLNEQLAGLCAEAPQRFSALAAAPLQDIDLAIAEMDHAVRTLGLAGVEIGSNVHGVPIGDPRFDPFFEAAESLGAAIFVHPLRPAGLDRLVGPASLEQVLAFPGEIGLAAASVITGGLLRRRPGLRIAFSHGGGSLQVLMPRLMFAWEKQPALREACPVPPLELARKLYYDDLLYDANAIRNLITLVGDTQVMVGTDYPFAIMDPDPVGRAGSVGLAPAEAERLRGSNAARWLNLVA